MNLWNVLFQRPTDIELLYIFKVKWLIVQNRNWTLEPIVQISQDLIEWWVSHEEPFGFLLFLKFLFDFFKIKISAQSILIISETVNCSLKYQRLKYSCCHGHLTVFRNQQNNIDTGIFEPSSIHSFVPPTQCRKHFLTNYTFKKGTVELQSKLYTYGTISKDRFKMWFGMSFA